MIHSPAKKVIPHLYYFRAGAFHFAAILKKGKLTPIDSGSPFYSISNLRFWAKENGFKKLVLLSHQQIEEIN